jgi:hypothetical protein
MSFFEFLNEKRLLEELGNFPDIALKAGRKKKFLVVEYSECDGGIKLKSNQGKVLAEHDVGQFLHADLLCHFLEAHDHQVKLKEI